MGPARTGCERGSATLLIPFAAQEESAKGPRRRKRKVKVKKKGLGQPGPAEEPEGPGAGAAGGLLLPNRVGQEEPTPHPGERGRWVAASPAGPQSHPTGRWPGLAM